MTEAPDRVEHVMDPIARRVVSEYARGLLETADDEHAERLADELDRLGALVREIPGLRELLRQAGISRLEATDFVRRTFPGRVSPEVEATLMLMARNGRIHLLEMLPGCFREQLDRREGKTPAVITTAVPLEAPQRESILATVDRATGRKVAAKFRVDPDLLGGIRVQVADRLYDSTVAGDLDSLREALAHRQLEPTG